ncbi:hypothetical protein NJ7G_3451 [Natrinema sp. J7-2]|nr:hypothetical protein NJ7G_3451 [Natrinema sp. J7-2]
MGSPARLFGPASVGYERLGRPIDCNRRRPLFASRSPAVVTEDRRPSWILR